MINEILKAYFFTSDDVAGLDIVNNLIYGIVARALKKDMCKIVPICHLKDFKYSFFSYASLS